MQVHVGLFFEAVLFFLARNPTALRLGVSGYWCPAYRLGGYLKVKPVHGLLISIMSSPN